MWLLYKPTFRRNLTPHFVFLCSVRRLPITANVPSSPILVTMMKEALSSSETSVLTRAQGVTCQKMPFFIVTAVKTSNLTRSELVPETSAIFNQLPLLPRRRQTL
jgi:hypothetical protein